MQLAPYCRQSAPPNKLQYQPFAALPSKRLLVSLGGQERFDLDAAYGVTVLLVGVLSKTFRLSHTHRIIAMRETNKKDQQLFLDCCPSLDPLPRTCITSPRLLPFSWRRLGSPPARNPNSRQTDPRLFFQFPFPSSTILPPLLTYVQAQSRLSTPRVTSSNTCFALTEIYFIRQACFFRIYCR